MFLREFKIFQESPSICDGNRPVKPEARILKSSVKIYQFRRGYADFIMGFYVFQQAFNRTGCDNNVAVKRYNVRGGAFFYALFQQYLKTDIFFKRVKLNFGIFFPHQDFRGFCCFAVSNNYFVIKKVLLFY